MRPGHEADHPPPSSAEVMKDYSYTSTPPLGPCGLLQGEPLPYLYLTFTLPIVREIRDRIYGLSVFWIRWAGRLASKVTMKNSHQVGEGNRIYYILFNSM
jgi:hypothetical protein